MKILAENIIYIYKQECQRVKQYLWIMKKKWVEETTRAFNAW